jgi:hypothetical protein
LHAVERLLLHYSDFRERTRRKGHDKTELKGFEYLKGENFGTDRLVILEQYRTLVHDRCPKEVNQLALGQYSGAAIQRASGPWRWNASNSNDYRRIFRDK